MYIQIQIQMYILSKIPNMCFFSLQNSISLRQRLLSIAVLYMQVDACTKVFWLIYIFFVQLLCNLWCKYENVMQSLMRCIQTCCTWRSARFLEYPVYVICALKTWTCYHSMVRGHHFEQCWISWKCHNFEHCSIINIHNILGRTLNNIWNILVRRTLSIFAIIWGEHFQYLQ